jgi:hypothetical protein
LAGEYTLNRHDQAVSIGGNSLEKRFGRGFHMAVQQELAILAQEVDAHAAGMPIDLAVKGVGVGVESHEVSSYLVNLGFSTTSITLGYAEEGGFNHDQHV